MIFALISIIYGVTILFFVGSAALILLVWTRRRFPDRSPSDLTYVAVGVISACERGNWHVGRLVVVLLGDIG
jgi:hypothetical protein